MSDGGEPTPHPGPTSTTPSTRPARSVGHSSTNWTRSMNCCSSSRPIASKTSATARTRDYVTPVGDDGGMRTIVGQLAGPGGLFRKHDEDGEWTGQVTFAAEQPQCSILR